MSSISKNQVLLITVASLGYFVDIYDITLFNIIKIQSLKDLGIWSKENEISLLNWQMFGMFIGGIVWGIMGDKIGRIKVLFGSILMYSLANIGNAYAWDLNSYMVFRFIAGFGLAGELGAGITLILESMNKKDRGWGTMIMVTFGVLGATFAYYVGEFGWKTAYWVGGIMGLLLLVLRMGVFESGMFKNIKHIKDKGNILILFKNKHLFLKYMACIFLGLPIWYVVAVLIALSSSYFGPILGIQIDVGKAVMFCYIGLAIGDFASGLLSQLFKTRLGIIYIFLAIILCLIIQYIYFSYDITPSHFYLLCMALGIGSGYWALFVTVSAEQFGTNIRATVATTVPNWVRGAVIPITILFKNLAETSLGAMNAALIVGLFCLSLALISALHLKDSFGKDLDFIE